MTKLITIFMGMAIINNFVLAKFLGLCPFFGVSKKTSNAISMGIAVTLVMVIASVATYFIERYILIPFDVVFMQIVIYILVIAALVQVTELTIKRTNVTLYNALGIYLPLITTNCAVLGITLIKSKASYNLLEACISALGGGLGFLLVLVIMSGIRERLELCDCPQTIKGLPLAFLVAALLALSFMGFAGMV